MHIEQVLCCIETLMTQIKEADEQLKLLAKDDPVCQRLMTVPGVGPVVALRFTAVIDDTTCFRHAHDVMSNLGLTPGENSSSTRKQRTGITKAGAQDLRFALVLWCKARGVPCARDPTTPWCNGLCKSQRAAIAALRRLPWPENWQGFSLPSGGTTARTVLCTPQLSCSR